MYVMQKRKKPNGFMPKGSEKQGVGLLYRLGSPVSFI